MFGWIGLPACNFFLSEDQVTPANICGPLPAPAMADPREKYAVFSSMAGGVRVAFDLELGFFRVYVMEGGVEKLKYDSAVVIDNGWRGQTYYESQLNEAGICKCNTISLDWLQHQHFFV